MGFFKRTFEKTLFSTNFRLWSPISQNWDQRQGPWFRKLYKRFIGYILTQNWRQFFFVLGVFGQKEDKHFFEKFLLIPSSFFSKLMKDTETVLFWEEQHWYRLLFGLTKLPSSSMTPSFFCRRNFIFSEKNFLVLFNLSSYISWPRLNMGFMVSLILRGLCRLRFRIKVISKFFRSGFF